jgi:sec-independent protein translocase protein TatA
VGNIGVPELMIILVIALLFFGPKKLPDFARSMGQAIREFRRASQEVIDDLHRAASAEPSPTKHSERPVEAPAVTPAATTEAEAPAEPEAAPEPTLTKHL